MFCADDRFGAFHCKAFAVLNTKSRHITVMDDVNALVVCEAGIAPCDRVIALRAAVPLGQTASDQETRIVKIEERVFTTDLCL